MEGVDNVELFVRKSLTDEDIKIVYSKQFIIIEYYRPFLCDILAKKGLIVIVGSGYDTLFTIKLHHGGKFTKFPSRCYVDGEIDHIDMIDVDKFCVHDLDGVMLRLGYTSKEPIYYHFLQPGKDLDYGLQTLSSDSDVLKMTSFVPQHRVIFVYTEHGHSKLPIVSNSHVRIEEINEGDEIVNGKEVVSNVMSSKSVNGMKNVMSNSNVMKKNILLLEWDENMNVADKSVNVYGVETVEEDCVADVDEEDDTDYIVDECNNMDDYEVDMRNFRINVDSDVDDVLEEDNEASEDEVLDNDTFVDGRQRNPHHGTIHFYLGQVFGTKEECKTLIRDHSVETRRNIRVIKDEDFRVRAICKGSMGDFGSSSNGPTLPKQKSKRVVLQQEKGVLLLSTAAAYTGNSFVWLSTVMFRMFSSAVFVCSSSALTADSASMGHVADANAVTGTTPTSANIEDSTYVTTNVGTAKRNIVAELEPENMILHSVSLAASDGGGDGIVTTAATIVGEE
ncbi:hypothetical protein SSX86_025004 [Deinandra increscens subsp. villosa]|uniref:PB1-like domain-containing protein n=1 Tax=Deinandra increscens subsp. villosa TaxID=3103831 RepID=A0AAP0CBR7_9ASTR